MAKRTSGAPAGQETAYRHRNRTVVIPDGYMAVGHIVKVHGLQGEVKVELHTDFPERFQPGAALFLGDDLAPVEIVTARPHKGHYLLRFAGVHRREEADRLRNLWLFIHEEDAAELDEDTYWIHDLVGLTVETTDGDRIGRIVDVMQTGANDVYLVAPEEGPNQGQELLLPAIADVVQSIDLAAGIMTVALIPGLLDE